MVFSTIGRILWVAIAFIISAAGAIALLFMLGMEKITAALSGKDTSDSLASIFDLMDQGLSLASGITLLPALAVVIIGEVARIKSSVYYIVGGGAALAAIPLLARFGPEANSALSTELIWQLFATAGFAGGLLYWLLAGRTA